MTPVTEHQLKIAKKTLTMPDAMVAVMGGMTKAEAKLILGMASAVRPKVSDLVRCRKCGGMHQDCNKETK